jgi:hypothetical protein
MLMTRESSTHPPELHALTVTLDVSTSKLVVNRVPLPLDGVPPGAVHVIVTFSPATVVEHLTACLGWAT